MFVAFQMAGRKEEKKEGREGGREGGGEGGGGRGAGRGEEGEGLASWASRQNLDCTNEQEIEAQGNCSLLWPARLSCNLLLDPERRCCFAGLTKWQAAQ